MNQLSGAEVMTYSNGNLCASNTAGTGNAYLGQATNLCYDNFYHYYPQWYPSYHYVQERSKVEQAFKIVGKLLEKDLIEKELTVKQFMKLVNEIAEII
jgi:hypothetical protein